MPDAQGNIKGIALGGKAAESWERIFGAGGLEEQQRRYEEQTGHGAYKPLDFSGPWPRAKDWPSRRQ